MTEEFKKQIETQARQAVTELLLSLIHISEPTRPIG